MQEGLFFFCGGWGLLGMLWSKSLELVVYLARVEQIPGLQCKREGVLIL